MEKGKEMVCKTVRLNHGTEWKLIVMMMTMIMMKRNSTDDNWLEAGRGATYKDEVPL